MITVIEIISQLNKAISHLKGNYTPAEIYKQFKDLVTPIAKQYNLTCSEWDLQYTIIHDTSLLDHSDLQKMTLDNTLNFTSVFTCSVYKTDYKNRTYNPKWKVIKIEFNVPTIVKDKTSYIEYLFLLSYLKNNNSIFLKNKYIHQKRKELHEALVDFDDLKKQQSEIEHAFPNLDLDLDYVLSKKLITAFDGNTQFFYNSYVNKFIVTNQVDTLLDDIYDYTPERLEKAIQVNNVLLFPLSNLSVYDYTIF